MSKIAIILGSTRPNRNGPAVAQWVLEQATARETDDYEIIDLADIDLPFLDEPVSPMVGNYAHDHTRAWGAKIAPFDGFVFVVPEYNHSFPAVLKNALDFLFAEWNDKAAAIVSYGGTAGGARAAEQLRLVLAELRIASVQSSVALSFRTDFENASVFTPHSSQEKALSMTLDQLESWSRAFQTVRPGVAV